MWSTKNDALVKHYGYPTAQPSDTEYGDYVIRELLSLGFAVKRMRLSGGNHYIISLEMFGGTVRAIILCKTSHGSIDLQTAQSLMALRSMYKASKYVLLTNRGFSDQAKHVAFQNHFSVVEGFYIGCEILDFLGDADLLPSTMCKYMIYLKAESDEQARIKAEEEERLRLEAEAEAQRHRVFAVEEVQEMTPLERYTNGLYDPRLPEAIAAVSVMDVVSIGGLARKLKVEPETARLLLQQLEELEIVGPSEQSRPRDVIMTQGMIEKRFGIRVRTGLGSLH